MKIPDSKIISDQEAFFNKNAEHKKNINLDSLFSVYANKEQLEGLKWIADKKNILEYGCGTGTSLDVFFKTRRRKDYQIYGVDIAGVAIKKAKENYPEFTFYKISNNKIPQIRDNSLDAVFMFHVLHHADKHEDIFKEIHKKLKKMAKFSSMTFLPTILLTRQRGLYLSICQILLKINLVMT